MQDVKVHVLGLVRMPPKIEVVIKGWLQSQAEVDPHAKVFCPRATHWWPEVTLVLQVNADEEGNFLF